MNHFILLVSLFLLLPFLAQSDQTINFNGTGRVEFMISKYSYYTKGSGSLVILENNQNLNSNALFLTAGHVVLDSSLFKEPNLVLSDEALDSNLRVKVFKENITEYLVFDKNLKIVYASIQNKDVALIDLGTSYKSLIEKGFQVFTIPANPNIHMSSKNSYEGISALHQKSVTLDLVKKVKDTLVVKSKLSRNGEIFPYQKLRPIAFTPTVGRSDFGYSGSPIFDKDKKVIGIIDSAVNEVLGLYNFRTQSERPSRLLGLTNGGTPQILKIVFSPSLNFLNTCLNEKGQLVALNCTLENTLENVELIQ